MGLNRFRNGDHVELGEGLRIELTSDSYHYGAWNIVVCDFYFDGETAMIPYTVLMDEGKLVDDKGNKI